MHLAFWVIMFLYQVSFQTTEKEIFLNNIFFIWEQIYILQIYSSQHKFNYILKLNIKYEKISNTNKKNDLMYFGKFQLIYWGLKKILSLPTFD